jgi:predicted kinase
MRKWMRERLTRRKKKDPEKAGQTAPPPLQPAYFDAEQQEASTADAPEEMETAPTPDIEAESSITEQRVALAAEAAAPAPARQRPRGGTERGRRRRGGRGRGGRGREQSVAQASTPAAVKGTAPVLSKGESGFSEAIVPADMTSVPAVPAAVASAPRPPKGLVVLAIGLPGSGKSTWFKRHNIVPLSSDLMRSLLFDDVREQRFQDLVFSNLRSMLKARLIAKRPTNYVDATNLTPQERQHWIKLAKDYQYEVHALFFDVPFDVCLERHSRRDRVVPEDVMRRMAAKLKAPAFTEGFAKITVVRVKKKEENSSI